MASLTKFRRVISQPGDGSDFTVSLPEELDSDDYGVFVELVSGSNLVGFQFPDTLAGDRTTTAFRCVTTSALANADVLEFTVVEDDA